MKTVSTLLLLLSLFSLLSAPVSARQSRFFAVKRVDADNQRLRERLDKVESMLDEVKGELRNRDRRIDEMSDELVAFRGYSIELRDALQSQDPTLRLPEPPARIARHFLPP